MKLLAMIVGAIVAAAPVAAFAHPHIWISQLVRVISKDGKFTHVEIEWRFDPFSSEIEIPLIDENGDGKFSAQEAKTLGGEMIPELQKYGFMTWLNSGAKDFRPTKPGFSARIDDPASFKPAEWDSSAGDKGQPMPQNKRVNEPPVPQKRGPRNLVYVLRFELLGTPKTLSITSYDPDDFIRIEVDKASVSSACSLSKHPSHKAEFIRGYPVFADVVSCQAP